MKDKQHTWLLSFLLLVFSELCWALAKQQRNNQQMCDTYVGLKQNSKNIHNKQTQI